MKKTFAARYALLCIVAQIIYLTIGASTAPDTLTSDESAEKKEISLGNLGTMEATPAPEAALPITESVPSATPEVPAATPTPVPAPIPAAANAEPMPTQIPEQAAASPAVPAAGEAPAPIPTQQVPTAMPVAEPVAAPATIPAATPETPLVKPTAPVAEPLAALGQEPEVPVAAPAKKIEAPLPQIEMAPKAMPTVTAPVAQPTEQALPSPITEPVPAAHLGTALDASIEAPADAGIATPAEAARKARAGALQETPEEIAAQTAELENLDKAISRPEDQPITARPKIGVTREKESALVDAEKLDMGESSADMVTTSTSYGDCDGYAVCCPVAAPVCCEKCPRRICRPACCKTRPCRQRRCLPECLPVCCPLPRPTVCPDPIPVCCPPPRARCCKVRRYCCPRPVKHCPPAVYCSPTPSICPMPRVVCPPPHPGFCYKPCICQPVCADNKNLITYKHMEHVIGPNQRVLMAQQVQTAGDRMGLTVEDLSKKTKKKVAQDTAAATDLGAPEAAPAEGQITDVMA